MKVGIVSWQKWHGRPKGSIGSSVLRADWLADAWDEAEIWQNGQKYDAYIFQKVWDERAIPFIQDIKEPKIFDSCDPDYLRYDPNNSLEKIRLRQLEANFDAITTSTEALAECYRKVIKKIPVVAIEDRLNLNFFPKPKEPTKGRTKTVVWFGYSHNAEEVLPYVLPSLKKLGLRLVVIADRPYNTNSNFGVTIENIKYNADTAYYDIQEHADIVLNPKSFRATFKYKSNNKTYIPWALGIPVAVNNLTEEQAKQDEESWLKAHPNATEEEKAKMKDDLAQQRRMSLDYLLDEESRKKERELRLKEVHEKHTIQHSIKQFKELLWKIQKTKQSKK